ncbi:hypothetical protein ACHAPJ_013585 [Fusarium lateritium]
MSLSTQLLTMPLGKNGPSVVRLGLGLMSSSANYGLPAGDDERFKLLDKAHSTGAKFWDTADSYGDSEDFLGKWFAANPDKRQDIFLATKFANRGTALGPVVDSSPEWCQQAIERSLTRLGVSYIDLYYVHRVDKVTPIEKTIQALAELKKMGQIKNIGLSECSAETLRRAYAVHPIAAVQMEYNPFCLEIESPKYRLLEVARELGVAIVAYSPLANGVLTGAIRSRDDVSKPGDVRGWLPWLSEENIQHNLAIVGEIAKIAEAKNVTLSQLILAWILKQGSDFFPIPGTTKPHRLVDNLKSLEVKISDEEDKRIRELGKGILGDRYPEAHMSHLFADTPALE